MERLMRKYLWLGLVFIASAAGAQGRPLAIEDYYRLKVVGAPQLSPDGRWVAYTISTRTEATNADSVEVWLASTSASPAPMRVSAPGVNANGPQWLDDGRVSWSSNGRRLAWTPASTTAPTELNPSVLRAQQRQLPSPDGKWVISVREMPVAVRAPAAASDFEKRHEARFRGAQFDWLDFQRDGQAFPVPNRVDPRVSPPTEVFISPAGDSSWRPITNLGLRPAAPEWNRDATLIVFTADSQYRDERKYGGDDIYTATRDGKVTRLTTNDEYDYNAARFSPDGKWILYTRGTTTDAVIAKKMDNGGPTDIGVIPAAGGAEKILTLNWDFLPGNAQWSPDSRWIYFTGGIGGTTHLFRVSPNGGAVEQVTKGERRITGLSFDKTMSRMAYSVGLRETPAEIHVANIDGSAERKLTNVHDEFTREIALSKSDRLEFTSKDGTRVEGWLMYPHGFRRDGGPYPLVVANHGGPHAADGYTFDFKNQYMAANGYFVLQVNFRSSTGYGEKFLWGTWGAWGDRDGEDVMAGVDYVLARQPIDRRRVATIGHSYGGFMTNWLITQYPDRFAAAVPGAGIVNWVSDYGTADIARTKETEFFGTPWEEKARNIMIRQSPLTYAGRVRTPTLFIHGEVDQRVPYSEAEQMYVALKKNGVPAKMIMYQGMPHSISGSWNVVHRMLNERQWLDTYLKPVSP
jgi:dipeptidyl aminopeptidase/acylaminoacyl peptidase